MHMPRTELFMDGEATDPAYRNVRAAGNSYLCDAREHCEDLWRDFEPHADREFRIELMGDFDSRYWEMYLTTYFIRKGFEVTCPKPGPDVGIVVNGRRIWFEAVSPSRGAEGSADRVPEMTVGQGIVQDVPEERLLLRYLSSISEKYQRQYPKWLQSGAVLQDDALVVAINPRRLGWEYADTVPPRILQAAFQVGNAYAVINRESMELVRTGYHVRDAITKAAGATVDTGVFQIEEFSALSGLLCSRVDAVNRSVTLGGDFQLVPNPHARTPLPDELRLDGTFFRIEKSRDGYEVIPEPSEDEGA